MYCQHIIQVGVKVVHDASGNRPFARGQASERNLRRALLILETCRVAQTPLQASQPLQLPDWELYIQACAALAVSRRARQLAVLTLSMLRVCPPNLLPGLSIPSAHMR